jgi:hypothetical protein
MHTLDNASTAVADFVNTANWQGVDDEPTAGSKNLVESGGINSLLLNNFFIGAGDSYKEIKILGIQPNHRYRIVLSQNDWDMSGVVSTQVYRFLIDAIYDDTSTHLAGTPVGQDVPLFYDITTPQQCDYITIGGRAASGVHVRFIIVDGEYLDTTNAVLFDKKTQVYITEKGNLIIKSVGDNLYFKATTLWALRGILGNTYTNSQLAEAMNVSLVDLSETDKGYIELQSLYTFVIDRETGLPAIKNRSVISIKDLVLLSCVGGRIVAFNFGVFGYQYIQGKFDDINRQLGEVLDYTKSFTFKSKAQFYNNESAYPIIKKVGTSLYFKSSSGMWAGRGALNLNYPTNAALATAMGVELVDISASDTGYIELPNLYSFVINSSGPAIKSRDDVTFNDVVLLANASGYIEGLNTDSFGYPYIEHLFNEFNTRITNIENNLLPTIVTENTDVLIPQIRGHQTSKGITFAFLTDLHNEAYPSIYNPNNNIIAKIKRMVQGINIIKKDIKLWATLVGGDYLTNNNTTIKSNALKALVDVTVSLNSINNLPKLMIKGNHDDNSMGTVADAINPEEFYDNSAKLFEENEIIIDSNNPSGCYGYFDIKPQRIRIIFLNSVDIPWIIENDTLKYKGQWTKGIQQAQLDFVKNALTFTENGWSVIFVSHHGVTEVSGYSTSADDYITPENGGSQLWGIIKAFKNKATFNRTITGDFASSVSVDFTNNASNQVICLLNGHTHCDRNAVKDGMLFLSTTTATQSNVGTNTDGSSYTPVANTKNEAAMDFITVDKFSGIIYLDRYGFGVSRKFYYTGEDIGEIPA